MSEMSVKKAIQDRRSVRQYMAKPIEKDKLQLVLEAARLAPSANNSQSWRFVVVQDESVIAKLADSSKQGFVRQAPAVIVACGTNPDSVMMCGQYRYSVDLSIAMSFMLLQAHELGLGTCWLGHFEEKELKDILGIPEEVRVVAISPLGYPAETPHPRPRKKLEDIVSYDKW